MNSPNVALRISLLWAIHLAMLAALIACGRVAEGWFYLCMGVLTAQTALAALWVVLGGGPIVLRGLGVLAIIAVIAWTAGYLERGRAVVDQFWLWYALFAVVGLVTAAPFVALRLQGSRLTHTAHSAKAPPEALQFSIRDLGLWTLAAALALGGFRWLANIVPSEHAVGSEMWMIVLLGVAFAAVGIVAAWAALGARFAPLRIAACGVVATLAGPAICLLVDRHAPVEFASLTVTEGLFVLASLLVLRTAGYRLHGASRA